MRVHHLNCASMCPAGAGALGYQGFDRLVAHCLLLETAEGLVLVDSGLGRADLESPRARLGGAFLTVVRPRLDPAETAAAQVERLGFSVDDVRHVVLTHLDLDHAGGIFDFPRAHTHVLMAEQEAAVLRTSLRERSRYRPSLDDYARWRLYRPRGESWYGFECVRALQGLPPEILFVPLTGHTRGHAGVAVDTGSGWLLHAGDAYFHHDELEGRQAPWLLEAFQSAMAMDATQRTANRARLADLHRRSAPEVRVFCAHDPNELAALS